MLENGMLASPGPGVNTGTNQLGPGAGTFLLNEAAPIWTQGRTGRKQEGREGYQKTHLRFLFYTVYENVSIIRGQYDCFHFINNDSWRT